MRRKYQNKNKVKYSIQKPLAILLAGVFLILPGCGSSDNRQDTAQQQNTANTTQAPTETEPQSVTQEPATKAPYGVTTLSLYIYNKATGKRERSDGYHSVWEKGKDIVSFEAFATDTEAFSFGGKYFDSVWNGYWDTFENSQQCKIGYIVSFQLKNGEEIKKTILHPDDVFSYRNYLECYLYDDVNQVQGNWYSHLLASEVTDKTVMTSIKFTAGTDIAQVGDTITLTAFVYSSDEDFDTAGNYTGAVSCTVTVKNTAD